MTPETIVNYKFSIFLRALEKASEKTISILVSANDLRTLKDNEYRLCIAKKVKNYPYNVVWHLYKEFTPHNTFVWLPKYQVFGSLYCKAGEDVRPASNFQSIGLGEQSRLDKYLLFNEPKTDGSIDSIHICNEYGDVHIGVYQEYKDNHGKLHNMPIFLTEEAISKGDFSFEPENKVLVWFEQDPNIKEGLFFSAKRSISIELDLTEKDSCSIEFKDKAWRPT